MRRRTFGADVQCGLTNPSQLGSARIYRRWSFRGSGRCAQSRQPGRARDPMKSLNLQLRFLLPLVVTLVVAAYLAVPLMDQLTLRWFARDLNMPRRAGRPTRCPTRSADALSDAKGAAPADAVRPRRAGRAPVRDRPVLARWAPAAPQPPSFPRHAWTAAQAQAAAELPEPRLATARAARCMSACTRSTARPARSPALVLLHDLSFIDRRSQDTRRYLIVLIARARPGDRADHGGRRAAELARLGQRRARACCAARACCGPMLPAPELAPLAADLRARLRDLEDEYRRSQGPRGRMDRGAPARAAAHAAAAATR